MVNWLRKFLSPPVFEDQEQTRLASLLNMILWVFLVLLGAAVVLLAGPYGVGLRVARGAFLFGVSGGLFLVFAAMLWLVRRRRVRLAATLLCIVLWGAATLWAWLVGGISGNRIAYVYPLIGVFAGLLLGSRSAVTFTILGAIGIVGAYSAERAGSIVPMQEAVGPIDLVVMISILFCTMVVLLHGRRSLNLALEAAHRSGLAQERVVRQLETMQVGLDGRVQQRTRDLEYRAQLLRGVVDVGRVAVAMGSPDELMARVVQSIAEHFQFTHVGIYLLEASSDQAVLRAVGGELDPDIPAVGYEMSTVDGSVVGECVRQRSPRIALSASLPRTAFSAGATWLSAHHARFPRTDVEVVFPLMVGGQPIGALDMHLADAGRFQLEDLEAWQIVSDQVAIAVENARRFAQSQATLDAERDYFARTSREGWMNLLLSQQIAGYRYKNHRVDPIGDTWPSEMDEVLASAARLIRTESASKEGGAVVAVPVRVRGNTIGVLHLRKRPEAGVWTSRELELLDTLTAQLETALESARLYRDTQLVAAQQRAIAEVGASIREEIEIEAVLSRALVELGSVLAAESGSVLFALDEPREDVV